MLAPYDVENGHLSNLGLTLLTWWAYGTIQWYALIMVIILMLKESISNAQRFRWFLWQTLNMHAFRNHCQSLEISSNEPPVWTALGWWMRSRQVGMRKKCKTVKDLQAMKERRIRGECCTWVGSNSDKCLIWTVLELANTAVNCDLTCWQNPLTWIVVADIWYHILLFHCLLSIT